MRHMSFREHELEQKLAESRKRVKDLESFLKNLLLMVEELEKELDDE